MTGDRDATQLLQRLRDGDSDAADELLPLVADELRRLASDHMRRENVAHTLQTTALVHEAWLRLVDDPKISWESRSHFLGVASRAMRNVLVDHARTRDSIKRGGTYRRQPLDDTLAQFEERAYDLLALDDALDRLNDMDPQLARLVELRFFGGLNGDSIAEVLGVSRRTVDRGWSVARSWLATQIRGT